MLTPISSGDDVGQRGLAQPGRPGQQHVIQRLAARLGRLDEDLQLLAQHRLAHERAQRARPQGLLQLLLERSLFRDRPVSRALCRPLPSPRPASRLCRPSACRMMASTGCVGSSLRQQLVGLDGREAQLHQRRPGQRQRPIVRRSRHRHAGPRRCRPGRPPCPCSSRMSRSAVFLPMPGTDENSGHVARGQRLLQLHRPAATTAPPAPAWARSCSRRGTAGTAPAPPRWRSRRAAARPRARAGG